MDLKNSMKKLRFLEKFCYALSSKKNVVSGFCLGVGASILVFTFFFFNNPFKESVLNPMFQSFNGLMYVNSSWPFSFSSNPFSSSSLQNSIDFLQRNEEQWIDQQKTNFSESGFVVNNEYLVPENTHEGNFTEKDNNSSFLVHKGGESVTEETHAGKDKNASSFVSSDGKAKTHEVDFSEKDKNLYFSSERNSQGSFLSGKGNNESFSNSEEAVPQKTQEVAKADESHRNESFSGKLGVRERMTNRTSLGKIIGDGKNVTAEERVSERTHKKMLHEKGKNAISSSHLGDVKRVENDSGKCDIFYGRWVRRVDRKPYYSAGSCPFIDRDFNCYLNGRRDEEFLKWQWQPNGCNIPSLNATDFLQRLRGKRLVFVGDSLNRNMWESLVCILRHSVKNKSRVYEISGNTEFKKNGVYSFRYEDYNCSIDFANAPFLVRQSYVKRINGSTETLRLDLIDNIPPVYLDADVIVFNSGHWWTHEKTSRGENYYQEGSHVYPKLEAIEAYKKALTTWGKWIDKNIDVNRTQVLFRGYSLTHFSGGQWNSGGQCHKETKPIFNETYLVKYPSEMKVLENVIRRMRTPVLYMNISKLTDYRKDAHPSIYRKRYKTAEEKIAAESSQDCSHWCLPGVPDTWNELLYASLLKAGIGSWGS